MAGEKVSYDPFATVESTGGQTVSNNPFASKQSETPISDVVRPVTDVGNRALVAGTLGAPVDLATMALRPFGYKEEKPVGGSEWIGQKMQDLGLVTPERRPIAETLTQLAPSIATGGVGAAKGAVNLAKKAKDYYSLAKGTEAERLANALKTNLSGKAEDVILGAEKAMQAPKSKLAAVGKAQEQLGGRESVAASRQAAREQEVSNSLDKLSPQKTVLAEDVGAVIQPEGQKNLQSLKGTRQEESITKLKEPAFEAARNREAGGDFIATNPKSAEEFNKVMGEIETQISRLPEPYRSDLAKRYSAIRGEEIPLDKGEWAVEQLRASIDGREPKTTKFQPMTLDQAEFMRRLLEKEDLSSVTGFKAGEASRMKDLAVELRKAMNAYEPRVGEYINKYKELSEPISRATVGRGKALTDMEIQAEENALFSSDKKSASNYFLDGSQEKAQRLLDLVGGKKQELVNSVRGFFRTKMENMSASQANQFVRDNEGFFRVFPELRSPMESVVRSKQISETAGVASEKRAASAATRLSGEAKTAEAAIKPQEKIAEKFRIYQSQLSTLTPKDSVSKAKELIDGLRHDKLIDDTHYRDLLTKVERIKNEYGDSAKAAQNVQLLLRKELIYGGLSSIGIGGGLGVGAYYGLKALGE